MKSSVIISTVALVAPGIVQATNPKVMGAGDLSFVPPQQRTANLVNQDMDACHKVDTRPNEGLDYPCVTQAWVLHTCRTNGTSAEHLNAHRDCMCGEGSSFFSDAKACSSCKTGYGLQGTAEDPFWHNFYEQLEATFCKAPALKGDFNVYYNEAKPQYENTAPLGSAGNPVDNKFGPLGVVEVAAYYPNAPAKQGPGKFTPVPPFDASSAPPAKSSNLVDGVPCAPAKFNVQEAAEKNSTAIPVAFKNTTSITTSIDIHVEYVCFVTAICSCVFDGPSMDSFQLSCGQDQVIESTVTKVETPAQKEVAQSVPDIGGCGCGVPKNVVAPSTPQEAKQTVQHIDCISGPNEKVGETQVSKTQVNETAAPCPTCKATPATNEKVAEAPAPCPTCIKNTPAGSRQGTQNGNSTVPVIAGAVMGLPSLSAAVAAGVAALAFM